MFSKIRKRNGHIVSFDKEKIAVAINKAGKATGEFGRDGADVLAMRVLNLIFSS
jgi:ribonucleoside-triphosphate reductase